MEVTCKALDVFKFKNMYINQRLEKGCVEKEQDSLLKINCFDSFDKDGYSHFFLVGKKGAVLNNKDEESILLYKNLNDSLGELKILDNSITLQEDLNIIEILRMSKKNKEDNDCLYRLGYKHLWRINEILNILGTPANNFVYMMFFDYDNIYKSISVHLNIDASDVEKMDKIYFYKKDNLPLRTPTQKEYDAFEGFYGSLFDVSIDGCEVEYIDSLGCPSKSLRDSIDKNNRSLTKAKIASSKIYTK